MFNVIYQFTVKPGQETAFEKAWRDMTELIYQYENSLGSRLHKKEGLQYIAYAQWPDRITWENSGSSLPARADEVRKAMRASCETIETLFELEVVDDLLKKHVCRSFETERLILRPTSVDDAAFIFKLLNTPKWKQYIGDRNVNSEEDARQYIINRMRPQLERLGFSNYTVIRKSDGVKLGTCGLYDREGLEGVDIGFAFLPAHEKKGYAFEAATKMMEVGLNEFGMTRIGAITNKENAASQNLLKKLGFVYVKNITLPKEEEELFLFEWKAEE